MKKIVYLILYGVLLAFGLGLMLIVIGIRINTSNSIPKGIYLLKRGHQLKDHYIIFCPEPKPVFNEARLRGYIDYGLCAHRFGYLMKKVVAVHGDQISSTLSGVFINGQLLPFSKPKIQDGLNRPLSLWLIKQYQLKSDEVFTMTDQSETSFDGRYYGPIHTSQIKGIVIPMITW
ncbi:MAG: conjugative transfer signal peptidase TraF [Legionella sp.]|uniref:conjugative transfer signal peptidase TraF n=1 Tax=Legionella sp. TaxID=459 RepID=UPI0039E225A7